MEERLKQLNAYRFAHVKFNGGTGALLCTDCSRIIERGFEHDDRYHYCDRCEDRLRLK